jgi:hypothetical protein
MDDLNGLERYLADAQDTAAAAEQSALREADVMYTARHRSAGLPRHLLALDIDPAKTELYGLLDPLAIMGENALRMTQSMAPPRTLEFLGTGIAPHYMKPTNNLTARSAIRQASHSVPAFVPRQQFRGEVPLNTEDLRKKVDAKPYTLHPKP